MERSICDCMGFCPNCRGAHLAKGPDLPIVPPALEACAQQITAPEKCPVCQGRYPDAAAELAFREEVAHEALEDCREDLAEALGKGEDDDVNNDWYAMLALVRRLASPPAPQETGASKQVAAAREEGRLQGLRDASSFIQNVADSMAREVVDPPLRNAKPLRGWGHRLAMATFLASELNSYAKATK